MSSLVFRLFQLPSIPLEIILKQIDPPQIIQLTMFSKFVDNILTRIHCLRLETYDLKWCYVKNDSKVVIALTFDKNRNSEHVRTRQIFLHFENSLTKKEEEHMRNCEGLKVSSNQFIPVVRSNWVINGAKMTFKRDGRTLILTDQHTRTKSAIEDLTNHLLRILNVKNFSFSTRQTESMLYRNLFFLKYTKKFQFVEIASQHVLPEEMDFLLNVIETAGSIQFNSMYGSPNDWDTQPRPPVWIPKTRQLLNLKHPTMRFGRFDWIDFESVLKMECVDLEIYSAEGIITATNIIDLVKAWVDGRQEKLKRFNACMHFVFDNAHFQETILNSVKEIRNITIQIVHDIIHNSYIVMKRKDGKEAFLQIERGFTFQTLP